ncbi:MAG: efflux RND transporter periplasmic adaptor subunit [Phycisphaerae bacterium]|nr:efflux RND transporter periplasmic adaptor subunit [Phycisphaerae bacterium]
MRMSRVAFLAAALTWGVAEARQGGPPPAPAVLAEVKEEMLERRREVTGQLRSMMRSLLASEEDGLVVELSLQEGDEVKAGQVVARMRDTRARLDVQRLEADVRVRQATLVERRAEAEKARRDVARMDEAMARGAGLAPEAEDRRSALAGAEARLASAEADVIAVQAQLDWARERLARMSIVAPFTARIVGKRTEVGQWLRQGDPVVELVALDQIEARLDVPEALVGLLASAGTSVQVRVTATGQTLEAPVAAIVPEADPMSRLFPVRVRLANASGQLRPGMSVVGLVPTGSRAATLVVPKDAILRDDAGEFVYAEMEGKAVPARVRTLFAVGDRVAVQSPMLRAGTKVVVEGNERMFPGQPLAPMPGGAGGAAGERPSEGSTKAGAGEGGR